MRLPAFIAANVEPILAEWEAVARGLWPDPATADPVELRDHAAAILRATLDEMNAAEALGTHAPGTPAPRISATPGPPAAASLAPHRAAGGLEDALDTASDQHGLDRVGSGFRLAQVLAEYRALRASVLRLWRDTHPMPDPADIGDINRFNDAIDRSLAQAVESFTARVDQTRQLFLAILGHDLRTPLAAIKMSAEMLGRKAGGGSDTGELAARVKTTAGEMDGMIRALLDFTAAGLGGQIPLTRGPTDLAALCRDVLGVVHAANPDHAVRFTHEGDARGDWDADRLRQVVANLLGNAIEHGKAAAEGGDPRSAGDPDHPSAELHLRGEPADAVLTVHNFGTPIPSGVLPMIFDPLARTATGGLPRRLRPGSIGLGLFIAKQIVTAHGGTIGVTSTHDAGTTFTLRLPRRAPA